MSQILNRISFKAARRQAAQTLIKVQPQVKAVLKSPPSCSREASSTECVDDEGTALGALTALVLLMNADARQEARTGKSVLI